jgi:hypothetical protein
MVGVFHPKGYLLTRGIRPEMARLTLARKIATVGRLVCRFVCEPTHSGKTQVDAAGLLRTEHKL